MGTEAWLHWNTKGQTVRDTEAQPHRDTQGWPQEDTPVPQAALTCTQDTATCPARS